MKPQSSPPPQIAFNTKHREKQMKTKKSKNKGDAPTLREQAEDRFAKKGPPKVDKSVKETDLLVHELQVHQIELEIQNEELRASQASTEESRRRFVELYEYAPVGYCTLDVAGKINELNLTAASLFKYSRRYLLSKPLGAFVHREDTDTFFLFQRRLREKAGEQRCELRLKRKDGQFFFVELISVPFADSGVVPSQFLVGMVDISGRKQAEEELHKQRDLSQRNSEFLDSILNGIKDGFIVLDNDWRISYFNHNAEVLLRKKKDAVMGLRVDFAFPESKSIQLDEQYVRSLNEGKSVSFEIYLDIEPYRNWYEVRLYPFTEGVCVFFTVITERKHIQEALEEHTRQLDFVNKELETFSYSVSHDLNAPLRVIKGFSDILLEDYSRAIDSEGKDFLVRIVQSVSKMQRLIDDVLSLSRVSRQKLEFKETDLSVVAGSILNDLRSTQPERTVELKIHANLKATVDPRLMHIALTNLLGNAWKYTGKTENPRIEFGSSRKNGETIFFIRDNGAGFDPKYADKLFLPFQRLHSESEFPGTGVGLATVARIISRHNGRIWAEGEKNKGATFYFVLGTDKN